MDGDLFIDYVFILHPIISVTSNFLNLNQCDTKSTCCKSAMDELLSPYTQLSNIISNPNHLIDQITAWAATLVMIIAIWAFLNDLVFYRYLQKYTNYDKVRRLNPKHKEDLYNFMCELENMDKIKTKNENPYDSRKVASTMESENARKELRLKTRISELAEIHKQKIKLQNQSEKTVFKEKSHHSSNNTDIDWHTRYNPYYRFKIYEDGPNRLKDFSVEESEIKIKKVGMFIEKCRDLIKNQNRRDHIESTLRLYRHDTISFYQLTDVLVPCFIEKNNLEFIGWLQILSPSYVDLIRLQYKVERFREEFPSKCKNLPLFQEIRSLIYVLGSPVAGLDLKHSAALSVIEIMTGKSLDHNDERQIHRGSSDEKIEELFVVCQGPKILLDLSEKHQGIRKASVIILRYLSTLCDLINAGEGGGSGGSTFVDLFKRNPFLKGK